MDMYASAPPHNSRQKTICSWFHISCLLFKKIITMKCKIKNKLFKWKEWKFRKRLSQNWRNFQWHSIYQDGNSARILPLWTLSAMSKSTSQLGNLLRILSQMLSAVSLDCVREYSNLKNVFSFPVNGFPITQKKGTMNLEFWLVSKHAIKIWDHLNENYLRY